MKLYHPLYLLYILIMGISSSVFASDYQLGAGYNIGDINISGYSNLVLGVPNKSITRLTLDDLSVFLSAHFNRYLNPFVEFELTSAPIFTQGSGLFGASSARLLVERAYNDIQLTDEVSVRIGKMLAPVGEWNTIHAAPLVWTTIRPLTTYYNFSEFVSGISLLYNDPEGLFPDVQLYYQPGDEIFREPRGAKPFLYQNVSGINITFNGDLQKRLGFSVQQAENINFDEKQVLASLDGHFNLGQFSFESQITHTWIRKENTRLHYHQREWGGYVQAVYAINDQWSLVSRGEIFQSRYQQKSSDHALLGIVYRPIPAISFKTEYIETFGSQLDISRGFYASMAVLF